MSLNLVPKPSLNPLPPAFIKARGRLTSVLTLSILIAGQFCIGSLSAQAATFDRALGPDAEAFHALMDGRVDDAANMLRTTLAANPSDALAHQLLCRVFYAQDQVDDAVHQCELAVSSPATNNEQASDSQLWLGRAYGMKARHAGMFSGFKLARKVQASFSRAVDLNSSSVDAINDLGEYDVSAPSIVNGGTDKARALAARVMPRFPATAHLLLARVAVSDNNLPAAESEFKQSVAVDHSPESWINLAQFYQSHSRNDEAISAVQSAITADRTHGPALVDAASILTKANRALDVVERCLRDYLASHAKSDAAPAFKVHLQLSRLYAARGDSANANREIAAATALAAAYTRRTAQGH